MSRRANITKVQRRAMRDALRAMGRDGHRAVDLARLGLASEDATRRATRGLRR
jgi:hypothetical protein